MLKILALLPVALFVSLLFSSGAQAANCGGEGQKSCWNVDPKKGCKGDLKYVPGGLPGKGRCVKRVPKPPKRANCGGLNQNSCWSANPKEWCKGDLKYVPGGLPGKGRCVKREPKPPKQANCGGLNQKSCWNANPKKWCKGDLKYVGSGVPGSGRCIAADADPTPNCGGLNQKSCWNANPAKWCDDGLHYVTKGMPGSGRCVKKATNDEIKAAASKAFQKIDALGSNNPLVNLRNCLKQPGVFGDLRQQMGKRSENGVNAILARCNASPTALRSYGQQATGEASSTLFIEVGGGAVAGVGAEGAIGYAIPLVKKPDGRYYLTGGVGGGVGAAVGADVSVGLSSETMPTEHWATDKGKSVNFSGKLMGAVSVSIDFPRGTAKPSGFTLSGGVGLGAEIGVVIATWDKYLYNY
jgi:hypothetical protein